MPAPALSRRAANANLQMQFICCLNNGNVWELASYFHEFATGILLSLGQYLTRYKRLLDVFYPGRRILSQIFWLLVFLQHKLTDMLWDFLDVLFSSPVFRNRQYPYWSDIEQTQQLSHYQRSSWAGAQVAGSPWSRGSESSQSDTTWLFPTM